MKYHSTYHKIFPVNRTSRYFLGMLVFDERPCRQTGKIAATCSAGNSWRESSPHKEISASFGFRDAGEASGARLPEAFACPGENNKPAQLSP